MPNIPVFGSETPPFEVKPKEVLHSSDILPGSIKQRHMEPNARLIFVGLAANLPDGSTEVKVYYEFDTKKLKIWNTTNVDWDEVQLA